MYSEWHPSSQNSTDPVSEGKEILVIQLTSELEMAINSTLMPGFCRDNRFWFRLSRLHQLKLLLKNQSQNFFCCCWNDGIIITVILFTLSNLEVFH